MDSDSKGVGGSDKLIRELFGDAEAELAQCNGDSTRSALHVVLLEAQSLAPTFSAGRPTFFSGFSLGFTLPL